MEKVCDVKENEDGPRSATVKTFEVSEAEYGMNVEVAGSDDTAILDPMPRPASS